MCHVKHSGVFSQSNKKSFKCFKQEVVTSSKLSFQKITICSVESELEKD